MQIKNKINLLILSSVIIFLLSLNIYADEFDISATEISIDGENNTVIGKGNVEAIDSEGRIIKADKIIYEKSKEFLTAEGSVKILDKKNNVIESSKATYDKINELISTFQNSKINLSEGYEIYSNKLSYNIANNIVSSDTKSHFEDIDGNIVSVDMFQYEINKNLFSSVGKIKIIDVAKNKYFFKELYVDTKNREMIGSDVSVIFDKKNFGVSDENSPRLVANDIYISKNKSNLSKGVFTVCKKRDGKCPPWSLKAKKVSHDKTKKTIYYDHATLKFYDIPIFYFPKFFHPDPSIKRKSGFLIPFFTDSTNIGTGFGLPYYWAISNDKDLTFTPKMYTKENMLLLNEYRQAFRNGFMTFDTSYTQGYKNTSDSKTTGSRNHIFTEIDFDLGLDHDYESNLSIKTQRVSNDTYFRIHKIDTALVDKENTDLKNEINYSFSKDNMHLNISGAVYENIREKSNSRYEYLLPNILYSKSFFSEMFGSLEFKSNTYYKNYAVNKHTSFLNNEVIWNPKNIISKNGFVNTVEGKINNTNYEAKNTTDYKNENTVNEISGVLSLKSSLPMKKELKNYTNFLSPNIMLRFAPAHMRNLSNDDLTLKYANLYSMNKTSVIEDGISAILGFDFRVNEKNQYDNKEKFSMSVGQVISPEENNDMPSKSSLDQKSSDLVGEMSYNFSKIGKIDYKFSLDHNFEDLNYNEVSTSLNFGKVSFNVDYLEEQNHVGTENYVNSGISLKFNENNKLSFETKKNFKTDSTEFYDLSYQYQIDCLTAGLIYRREFYEDSDVEQNDTLFFQITFVPFGGARGPAINP